MSSITPVQAATNATLGDLSATNPTANQYAGCVASVLAGEGVTFGSLAALGSDLAAIWPTLPQGLADACKQAVDGNQPQVCVNPADPATCPAVGAATASAAAGLAVSFPGTWKLATDGVGMGGYAETPLVTTPPWGSMATASGTFTTPTYVCTTKDCASFPPIGMYSSCGPYSCGPVTQMKVSVYGRTPNGESGPHGVFTVADGFGNVTSSTYNFGNWYSGAGCGPGDCLFNAQLTWVCKDALGAPANCGGQTLAVSFNFLSGPGGACSYCTPPAYVGQLVEIQLGTDNLASYQNPTVCPGVFDCMRYDDHRLAYLDGSGRPTVMLDPGASPSAVNNLAASGLGCLVGVDVTRSSAISCLDVTGSFAPLLQTAHALIAPPTISASASPAGGWQGTPVTVSLAASADPARSIRSITYSASGAQPMPPTVVAASTAQVVVSADGATTLTAWATDTAGTSSSPQSVTVQVDRTAPAIACATPSTAWSSTDLTVACQATDYLSGLADPTQAQLILATSVPAGSETAAATTGSVTVCDTAGNCAAAGPITGLRVDRLGPSITTTAPAGNYTAGQSVDAAYACADGGSGVATCSGPVPSGSPVDTATLGTHSFTVDATDAVGNHTQSVVSYLVAAPPTITASASPSGGWPRTPVTVSLSASADPSRGVQSITYSSTGAQVTPETVVQGAAATVVVSADGVTTVSAHATDTAGASSTLQSITVRVDQTAPAIACATPSTAWSATDVTVACTAGDGASGLADPTQAQLTLATSVPAGTETSTAATGSATVCDVAGNCATAGPLTGLKVDRLGPAITITAPAGTYTLGQVVNAAYGCTDGGSGIANCTGSVPSGGALNTATEGLHSFTVDATDAVGNHTQLGTNYVVAAPPPPPTVTASANPSGGWQRTPVTITLTATDGFGPGVGSIGYQAAGGLLSPETIVPGSTAEVVVDAEGVTTLTYWATDTTGSSSSPQSITVEVDRSAPVIACAAPSTAWSSTDVTVYCMAGDALSGLASPTQAQLTLSTSVPAGTETSSAATGSLTVCDVAGNCAAAGPITGLKVDRLGPSITITAPTGTYTAGQVVKAAYTCSDGGSGVTACTGSVPNGNALDTAVAGTHSFTVDATDAVGNHSQTTVTYAVTAVPTPTPSPLCKHDENASAQGDPHADKKDATHCDVKGAAVRPVASPTPVPAPTHKPLPKPSPHGDGATPDPSGA